MWWPDVVLAISAVATPPPLDRAGVATAATTPAATTAVAPATRRLERKIVLSKRDISPPRLGPSRDLGGERDLESSHAAAVRVHHRRQQPVSSGLSPC